MKMAWRAYKIDWQAVAAVATVVSTVLAGFTFMQAREISHLSPAKISYEDRMPTGRIVQRAEPHLVESPNDGRNSAETVQEHLPSDERRGPLSVSERVDIARQIFSTREKDDVLRLLTAQALSSDDVVTAFKAANGMFSTTASSAALLSIANHCVSQKRFDCALKAARLIPSNNSRDEALALTARACQGVGNMECARSASREIFSLDDRDAVLKELIDSPPA